MPMCRNTELSVQRAVTRELEVHVLAANAGAELPEHDQYWVTGTWSDESGQFDGPGTYFHLPCGWAAWYASGDELP